MQDRVGEQAGAHRLLSLALLLELGHPAQLAERRRALEQPGELGVLGDVALHEDRADRPGRARRRRATTPSRGCGRAARRVVSSGEGVQVDDAEERVRLVLVRHPLAEGAEVVADVRRTGGLNAREDSFHRPRIAGQRQAGTSLGHRVSDHARAIAADNLAPVAYEVRTDVFEGPFDLLLRLITEQRVDLYEVALSDIVDAFLAEVEADAAARPRGGDRVPPHRRDPRRAEVPATPARAETSPNEEDLALLEERDYLLARLVECTTFSAAGRRLAALEMAASRSWPRLAGLDERFEGCSPTCSAVLDPRRPPGGGRAGARAPGRSPTSRRPRPRRRGDRGRGRGGALRARCRGARRSASAS